MDNRKLLVPTLSILLLFGCDRTAPKQKSNADSNVEPTAVSTKFNYCENCVRKFTVIHTKWCEATKSQVYLSNGKVGVLESSACTQSELQSLSLCQTKKTQTLKVKQLSPSELSTISKTHYAGKIPLLWHNPQDSVTPIAVLLQSGQVEFMSPKELNSLLKSVQARQKDFAAQFQSKTNEAKLKKLITDHYNSKSIYSPQFKLTSIESLNAITINNSILDLEVTLNREHHLTHKSDKQTTKFQLSWSNNSYSIPGVNIWKVWDKVSKSLHNKSEYAISFKNQTLRLIKVTQINESIFNFHIQSNSIERTFTYGLSDNKWTRFLFNPDSDSFQSFPVDLSNSKALCTNYFSSKSQFKENYQIKNVLGLTPYIVPKSKISSAINGEQFTMTAKLRVYNRSKKRHRVKLFTFLAQKTSSSFKIIGASEGYAIPKPNLK